MQSLVSVLVVVYLFVAALYLPVSQTDLAKKDMIRRELFKSCQTEPASNLRDATCNVSVTIQIHDGRPTSYTIK
jgi:hypothetical protein